MARTKKKVDTEPFEEKIIDVEYSEVMRKSYIDYSMSVIISRAVPDIRDGLKPVQRRIIYDMDEIGASSDKPYRKSARIDGDTMGKYHPHGSSSIYDALVVMAQDFKKGKTLVDGHGNFGSIEGDGAAADRYTEARLQKFTEKIFLSDLDKNTVNFVSNYDESEKEPEILPCKLPNFLINGSEGIAVGMTTSTPTHNISEVIDLCIAYLGKPNMSLEQMMEILPGPDFPTGGIISNKNDLKNIYETGVGKIKVRGRVEYEQGKGSEKDKLVITEIPYTMIGDGITKFLQNVAELVENRTLPEIVDITNQTSNDGIRIVLELKKGTDYKYVENVLYKKTRLEDTFGVNMLAVHNGRPEIMNLKTIMQAYEQFQYEINTRKYQTLLDKVERRKEVLDGLIVATNMIDVIVAVLRGSKSIAQAKKCLMTGNTEGISFRIKSDEKSAKKLCFSELQADAILRMQLSGLVGLEINSLEEERRAKEKDIEKYKKLLSDKKELLKVIKKDLLSLKEEFGESRKTSLENLKTADIVEKEEEETEIVILVDKFQYVHAVDKGTYTKNADAVQGDYKYIIPSTNKAKLVVFCDSGKAHVIKTQEIPFGKLRDKGQPIDNICNYDGKTENVIGMKSTVCENPKLVFLSTNAFIKVVDIAEFDVTRKTVDATKLKDDGKLLSVTAYNPENYITIGTKNKVFIRFKQDEIPEQKKNAVGAIAMKLMDGDEAMYVNTSSDLTDVIKINDLELEVGKVKAMRRGGKGTKTKI